MTIKQLYSDMLQNIAEAQYDAYLYSQQLGNGQQASDSLFPIPIAEVKEITFDINFAYAKPQQSGEPPTTIVPATVFANLKPFFTQVISKARKKVIDEIDLSEASADPAWLTVKKNLLQGTLDSYALTELKQRFLTDAKRMISDSKIDIAQLEQLLIQNTADTFIQHPDVKKFARAVPALQLVKQSIEEDVNNNQADIQKAVANAQTPVQTGLDIIVDNDDLQKLPASAIQHARVVVDLRSILNDNQQQL